MVDMTRADSPEEAVAQIKARLETTTDPTNRLYYQVMIELCAPMCEVMRLLPKGFGSDTFEQLARMVAMTWAGTVAETMLINVPKDKVVLAAVQMAEEMFDGFMSYITNVAEGRVPTGIADMAPEGRA